MAQKAVRSEASSPNSLGPERDWPEVRGEECRPRTVLSWLLAKWVVGESEEAGRRTLSSHGPENPEEKEIALSLRRWVPLALGPAAEQKQNETEDSPPGPPPGEGAALFSPSPEKEQTPTSPGCPRQGRFVDFLDDLAYLQMAHQMKCWAPRGTDQRNHPGTGRDVRCVRSKRSVGACPAERLLQ